MKKFLLTTLLIFGCQPVAQGGQAAQQRWAYMIPASFKAPGLQARVRPYQVLCVGAYRFNSKGQLAKKPGLTPARFTWLKKISKTKKVYALVSLTSATSGTRLITDREAIQTATRELQHLLLKRAFDGIHIDFENISARYSRHFATFLRALKQSLPETTLSVAAFPPLHDNNPGFYNLDDISAHVDEIVFMMYDYHLHSPGPVTDLAWVKSNLKVILKKISPQRVWLGVPAYGYKWPGGKKVKGWPPVISEAATEKTCTRINCRKHASGMLKAVTNKGDVYYLTTPELRQRLANIATEAGLKGTATWRLGFEKF